MNSIGELKAQENELTQKILDVVKNLQVERDALRRKVADLEIKSKVQENMIQFKSKILNYLFLKYLDEAAEASLHSSDSLARMCHDRCEIQENEIILQVLGSFKSAGVSIDVYKGKQFDIKSIKFQFQSTW